MMSAKGWSLRRRLLAAIVSASVALWLASLGIVTVVSWQETNEVFDDALEESAYMLLSATSAWEERGLPAGRTAPERKVDMQYQIVAGGKVIQRSSGAPSAPFAQRFDDDDGFADVRIGGSRWRVFVVRDEAGRFEVQVGQRHSKRFEILEELLESLWLPVAGVLILLALVCWLLTGRVLQPLRRTATAIAARTPDDLALVPLAGQPDELLPIVRSLNALLGRLDAALQAERRFTADAAHELRTPLAGLHMHVQLLQRQHPELAASFDRLRQDIARVTALVDSLLTLARLDPLSPGQLARQPGACAVEGFESKTGENRGAFDDTNKPIAGLLAQVVAPNDTGFSTVLAEPLLPRRLLVPLAPVLERLLAAHGPLAAERGIALELSCRLDAVQADPQLLDILLRNLVDNALRYCPSGSRVELAAFSDAGQDRITVRDNGPGVDAASRARLTERFFRVLGQGQPGSGLGLSIVQRIADLHGIALAFGSGLDGRGLGVELAFPAAPADRVP